MITATCRLLLPVNRKHLNPLNFFYIREFASVEDFTTTKSKLEVGKDSLPQKPKKPLNVFLMYFTSVKNKLQEEYPHCNGKELVVKASQKWAQIDPTIKQNLQKQYLEQTSLYKKKLVDYENSLTNDQKVEIVQELLKKGQRFKKSEIKQKLLELGKPKRPLTAFMLFLQSKKIDKKTQVSYKDFICNMSEEWKNMTKEAKNKYNEEAKNLFEKYKIEIKKWEDNMIQAECPNQCSMPIAESITANFSNIRIENKENIKVGWGTDTTQYIFGNNLGTNSDRHEFKEGLVPYNNQNTLQTKMKYLKTAAMDTSIKDPKKTAVQSYNACTDTQIYTYFASIWRRVFTVLNEIIENWRTVREYIFIGTVGTLISIFCVLNLMYK